MPRRALTAIVTASVVTIAACPAIATAQEVPNLVGTWSGSIVGGARFGDLTHDPDQSVPVFADRTAQWRLIIEKQDGSGLIGTWARETRTEKLVGAIRQDNVTVLFADEDNLFDGLLLSANEMELCAQEAGAATIAVCFLMRRI